MGKDCKTSYSRMGRGLMKLWDVQEWVLRVRRDSRDDWSGLLGRDEGRGGNTDAGEAAGLTGHES